MGKYSHDLIVIGGGAAGLTLTSGAVQAGMKAAVIEKEHMGGDCLYFGCVPSKSILKSGSVMKNLKQAEKYGLPDFNINLSTNAALLTENISRVINGIAYHDSPERFRKLGAEVIIGKPFFLNEYEILVESESGSRKLSAPKITIAAGSGPMKISVPGLEETGYLTNRTVFSIKNFPEKLFIIGAGPIGVEMSRAFSDLGSEVTLLSNKEQILPVEDKDMAAFAENALTANGVSLIRNGSINKTWKENSLKHVEYTEDNKKIIWSGNEILVAAGRCGNIEGLKLENGGIEHNGRYITVNASLQTSRKHIMAIGDINGKYLFTHVAGAEGALAVKRQVFGLPGKMNYDFVPWVTYTNPEIASVGYNEKRAEKTGISYRKVEAEFKDNDRARAERDVYGKIKILIDRKDRVIGTQIAGIHAGELIGPAIFAVNGKWKISKLYSPVMPYPTLAEIYKQAIGSYMGPKVFNPKVRKILKIVKGYRGRGPE